MKPIALDGSAEPAGAKIERPGALLRQACLNAAFDLDLMFIEGHDAAILGIAEVDGEPRVIYDQAAIVRALMRRDRMSRADAIEFVGYNIAGAFPGDNGPVLLRAIKSPAP